MLIQRIHIGRAGSREPIDGEEDKEKEERRGPDSSSSALRQRTCPDGLEREGLWLKDKETLVNDKIQLLQMHRHTHTYTRTAAKCIVRLSWPLAPNIDGMFDCPPLAPLRHDVTPPKRRLLKEKQRFMCSGPHNEKRARAGREKGEKKI